MMIENHEMWNEIMKAAGPKRLHDATGYNLSTLYSFGRNPMDESPDGSGTRGILDRFDAVVDLLASRSSSRVTLRKLQINTMAKFAAALEREPARPATNSEQRRRGTAALRELADVQDECDKHETECDLDALITEILEVQVILDAMLRGAEARLIAGQQKVHPPKLVS